MVSASKAILVRRLKPAETELFRSVRLAALEDSPNAFGETLEDALTSDWSARTASLFESRPANHSVHLAIAEAAVGMVFARCGADGEPAFIGGMWVHPEFRRQGVGRSLMDGALEFLRTADQKRVSLWVTATHSEVLRFYEAAAFRRTGATSTLRPTSSIGIVELVRDLSLP